MALTPAEQDQAREAIGSISTFLTETDATNVTMQDVKDMFTDTMAVLTLLVG